VGLVALTPRSFWGSARRGTMGDMEHGQSIGVQSGGLTYRQRWVIRRVERQRAKEAAAEAKADAKAMARFEKNVRICKEVGHTWQDFHGFSFGGAETCGRCGVTAFTQHNRTRYHVHGTTVDA
jgi:hypothetical protein